MPVTPVIGFGVRSVGSAIVSEKISVFSSWIAVRTPSAVASPAWVSATWPVMSIVPVNGATQRRRLSTSTNADCAAACWAGVVMRPAELVAAPLPSGVELPGASWDCRWHRAG
jgi:hypothetical protein